jgi:phospholipid/cholesterol/gamma-HCH transport system substrate-binding protein
MSTAERGSLPTFPRRTLGLAFLLVIASFLAFTIASYQKVFTKVVWVELKSDRTGSQLVKQADVKIRGVRVGEVREISSSGDGVTFRLALDPDKVHEIPANVTARLVPKTLFGERYVNFVMPEQPSARRIGDGDVIGEDRTSHTIELYRVFDNLMPVLQAVQPQKIATTLTALSTALGEGRGEKLGQTLVDLNDYVRGLNPSLPDLTHDIKALIPVAETYNQAAPDLLQGLADLTTTSRTVLERRAQLDQLYGVVGTAAVDLEGFLRANKDNLIQLADSSRPTLDLLARYAPEYPCFFGQLNDIGKRLNDVWGGPNGDHKLHLTVEITTARGAYVPGKDEPRYEDRRGPACYPPSASQNPPGGPLKDGSTPSLAPRGVAGGGAAAPGAPNSPEERQLISALIGPQIGVPPSKVPGWSSLLVGPLYRGAAVTLK